MHASPRTLAPYRKPQDLEPCWQCTVTGRLYVYNPASRALIDSQQGQRFSPRCPCHYRLMRRTFAPWHGFPGWVGRAVWMGVGLYAVWTAHAAACVIPSFRTVIAGC